MQKFMNNLVPVLFFSLPLILGAVVYFFKIQEAVAWLESFNGWLLKKREGLAGKDGFVSKWFFRPMLWGLSEIMKITEQIQDQYMRSAVRICSYLYFAGILIYISLSIVIAIALLMLVLWFIFEVLLDDGSSSSRRPVAEKVRSKSFYDTKGIFNKKVGEVDEDGNVYDSTGIFKKKLGKIDDDGKVYDTTGIFNKQTGKIDEDGKIYDTTGIFNKQTGKINEDGSVDDTTGIFDKQVGKMKND